MITTTVLYNITYGYPVLKPLAKHALNELSHGWNDNRHYPTIWLVYKLLKIIEA